MSDSKFSVSMAKTNETTRVLTVSGNISAATANQFERKINDAFDLGAKTIIINMTNVHFLSSMGIRVILASYKKALKLEGSLKIERPSESVRNVIGMTHLDMLMA